MAEAQRVNLFLLFLQLRVSPSSTWAEAHMRGTQAVSILIHAKGYLACCLYLLIKGLSQCCDLQCFDLRFTKQVAQVCLIEYFQLYQIPTLFIQRCYTCETHRGQTAVAIIYVFFHSTTL